MTLRCRSEVGASVDWKTKAQIEELCRRMRWNGWIRSFEVSETEGIDIVWTLTGAERVLGARGISKVYGLASPRESVAEFSLALKKDGTKSAEFAGRVVPEPLREYWLSCEESLKLDEDPALLVAFVSVVRGWAPRIEADDFR